jgi:acyl-CoA synthetase (AMP-forming)/AMP-acid ligase II
MKTASGDRNLREVEAALREHPSIDDCVVLVREMEPARQELVAYVVPAGPFVTEQLHAHLQAILPADLTPRAYVPISTLPLTPDGHVDEQALTSHRNLLHMAAGTAQISNFTGQDVTLNWMPLDHVGAISFLSCMATYLGCVHVHALTKTILEDPLRWLDWIERHRATISWAPNFAFNLINDRAEEIARRRWDLSSMRFLVSAGEAVVAKTARRFLQLFRPHGLAPTSLHPAFGMSETCSGISWSESFSLETSSDQQSFVDVGPPIPGAALRIVNDKDQIVEEGTIGHLQLKGPSVMAGYYQNPEANKEAFTLDGWFRTGDLGFLDHGLLTLTGRGKDVIIINGINYYSHEIEAVVEEVKGVETSYTAGCAVREPSSIVDKLAIFFHAPQAKDGQLVGLLSEIRGRVARTIGVNPDYLIPVDKEAVPKTEIGKIQRGQLRERFEAGEFDSIRRQVDIGCLINILLLRANMTANPRFRELLGRVRADALAAYAHQDLPFEQLVEVLQP